MKSLSHTIYSNSELEIQRYKTFYKKNLLHLSQASRQIVLSDLPLKLSRLKELASNYSLKAYSYKKMEKEIEEFVEQQFGQGLLTDLKTPPEFKKKEPKYVGGNEPILLGLLFAMASASTEFAERDKQIHNYKVDILQYTLNCLSHYGLHPQIDERNPEISKRFNLRIRYKGSNGKMRNGYRVLIKPENFKSDFIDAYKPKSHIKIEGQLVPFEAIEKVTITTTLLADDEVELFALKYNFKWEGQNKHKAKFFRFCRDETEKYQPNPLKVDYNNLLGGNYDVQSFLAEYPQVLGLYNSALQKITLKGLERNALDDLRLSLECLLRRVLNNNKSLENQKEALGNYLKERSGAREITNMFIKLLDCYSKYQNENVKHNDGVNEKDVQLVVDLTAAFMRHVLGKN